jgi:hypothetical protein
VSGATNGLTKVAVNMTPRAMAAVQRVQMATGDSRTDVVNRAVQVYDAVLALLARGDGWLALEHADGTRERVTIL